MVSKERSRLNRVVGNSSDASLTGDTGADPSCNITAEAFPPEMASDRRDGTTNTTMTRNRETMEVEENRRNQCLRYTQLMGRI